MRAIASTLVGFVAVVSLATSARAGEIAAQAASGHPHITFGVADWDDETEVTIQGVWQIEDGRTIIRVPPGGSAVVSGSWDVPLPVSSTGVLWHAWGRAATPAGSIVTDFTQRICAFDSNGNFTSCGDSVTANAVSTVSVPTLGSAYSQSTLTGRGSTGAPKFFHVSASDI